MRDQANLETVLRRVENTMIAIMALNTLDEQFPPLSEFETENLCDLLDALNRWHVRTAPHLSLLRPVSDDV